MLTVPTPMAAAADSRAVATSVLGTVGRSLAAAAGAEIPAIFGSGAANRS
jgi:hypothetical protein